MPHLGGPPGALCGGHCGAPTGSSSGEGGFGCGKTHRQRVGQPTLGREGGGEGMRAKVTNVTTSASYWLMRACVTLSLQVHFTFMSHCCSRFTVFNVDCALRKSLCGTSIRNSKNNSFYQILAYIFLALKRSLRSTPLCRRPATVRSSPDQRCGQSDGQARQLPKAQKKDKRLTVMRCDKLEIGSI